MTNPLPDWAWEQARNLRNAVLWQSNASVEPIASALLSAYQQGKKDGQREMRERCEEIAAAIRRLR
jgi:hypothetical protein